MAVLQPPPDKPPTRGLSSTPCRYEVRGHGLVWCRSRLMQKAIRLLALLAVAAAFPLMSGSCEARAEDGAVETLSSQQKDFVFEVRKGQGNKVIKGFDARAGQKIRLVGFGAMSLDRLRSE